MSIGAYPKPNPPVLPFVYPHELPSSCVFMLDMQDGLPYQSSNNLLPLSACKFEGWTQYSGTDVTLTQGQAITGYTTDGATRIQTSGGADVLKCYASVGTTILNQQYSSAVIIKNVGAAAVNVRTLLGVTGVVTAVLAGETKAISISQIGNGTAGATMRFEAQNAGDSLDFIAYQPMLNLGTALPYEPGYIPSRGSILTDHANFQRKWTNTGGTWAQGPNLLAWQGDGVDDKISYGSDLIGVGDVTFEAVIRPTGWGAGHAGRLIDNGKFGVYVYATNQRIAVYNDGAGASAKLSAINSIELNKRYHVIVTRKSDGKVSIYINGKLSGNADQNSGIPAAGNSTTIGNNAADTRAFAGTIGLAKLHKGIWSAQNVAARYAEIAAVYGLAA